MHKLFVKAAGQVNSNRGKSSVARTSAAGIDKQKRADDV